jgi:hypothetical protein
MLISCSTLLLVSVHTHTRRHKAKVVTNIKEKKTNTRIGVSVSCYGLPHRQNKQNPKKEVLTEWK